MNLLKSILFAGLLVFPFVQPLYAAEFAGFDVRNEKKVNIDRALSFGYECTERVVLEDYKEIFCVKRTGRADDKLNYISFGDIGINIGCGVIALCHLEDFGALQFMLREENDIVRQAPEHVHHRTWMCWETASQSVICLTPAAEDRRPGWSVQLYPAESMGGGS
ncbi:hypothetical protein [Stappia sp. ES.058]|uniref:hypothetical protein n=1 Tax=Stappia sp. ES.058 TaxID=1881061 RepID=UPI00087964F0|nr:hypothetical protein [Stappia sp. ES.058]SDU27672.1 hypothetical protein SAMN05428979_2690 [Stappia sp. ES.058]